MTADMISRDARLQILAGASRVWDNRNGENVTPGLIDLCRDWIQPDFVMAEIGCFAGVSTAIFANFAQVVYAIDPWSLALATGYGETPAAMLLDAERKFLKVAAEYPNIIRRQEFSPQAAGAFADDSLDAVYIDGAHGPQPFFADVKAWLPKLKPAGLLMGHDWGIVSEHCSRLAFPRPDKLYSESSFVFKRSRLR